VSRAHRRLSTPYWVLEPFRSGGSIGDEGIARAAALIRHVVLHPPLIDKRLHPAPAVDMLADRTRMARLNAGDNLRQLVAAVVPAVVQEVLNTVDLNEIVRERLDLDGLVASVDTDPIINRVDINEVVRRCQRRSNSQEGQAPSTPTSWSYRPWPSGWD
jgi:hypothetical protein